MACCRMMFHLRKSLPLNCEVLKGKYNLFQLSVLSILVPGLNERVGEELTSAGNGWMTSTFFRGASFWVLSKGG